MLVELVGLLGFWAGLLGLVKVQFLAENQTEEAEMRVEDRRRGGGGDLTSGRLRMSERKREKHITANRENTSNNTASSAMTKRKSARHTSKSLIYKIKNSARVLAASMHVLS